MRHSYYSVLVDKNTEHPALLYNTLTQAFLELTDDELASYTRFETDNAVTPHDSEQFISQLVDMGFLVEDPEMQAEYLRYQCEKYKFDNTVLELYILPTLDCNFNCVYCYENKRPGKMSQHVQYSIVEFVCSEYAKNPFQTLKVVWYGGEPLLCVDVIENLSGQFLAFCKEHEVRYLASIISNSSLADENVLETLRDNGIWSFMVTTDGISEFHECRRCSRNGNESFETIMANIDRMIDFGFGVDFRCNVEKNNLSSCLELAKTMQEKENLTVFFSQIEDMNGFIERDGINAEEIDLLSLEEYAHAWFDMFMLSEPDAAAFRRALRPLWMPCPGTMERSYAIDERGNAYLCSCDAGRDERIVFNVCEPEEERHVNWDILASRMTMNPLDLDACHTCPALPVCMGGCARPRTAKFQKCKPFKFILPEFLVEYYKSLEGETHV